MRTAETAALVALLRRGHRSPAEYAGLVERARSAISVLRQEGAEGGAQLNLLAEDPEPILRETRAEIDRWAAAGIEVLTVLDAAYPQNLRQVHDRPPLLFVAGRLEPSDERSISVIGSRRASTDGLAAAGRIAAGMTEAGFTVVSGLAAGVDTAAHTSALRAQGRTVAVIGTGLTQSYPPENAGLQRQIAERCAVVSQFWPETPASRQSFPMRNAVMSGLTLATVIMLETGSGKRFAGVGQFSSYCRCVDSVRQSNGRKKDAGNTRNGNAYLAWAFIEAANFALRQCPPAQRFYERKQRATNQIVALKITAGNMADTKAVPSLTQHLTGKLFGDKGGNS